METTLALAAAAALVVAGAAVLGPRLRIPAPLILVVVGVVASALVPAAAFGIDPEVVPEVVLLGVLPPLLFASSVSLPTMDLRREFGTVSALSVVLVVLTALVLGWVLTLLIPGLAYPWGVALAAVISPTDAVATSIVKRTPVSHRVTAILEGESLLNDASALVLLRAAIAAGAGGVALSAPGILGGFAFSVVVAIVIGFAVGRLSVVVRARVGDTAVGTLLSFTVPFAAALPAEALDASGLVAAVAAGLTVGRNAPRSLSPQQRTADAQNWRTVSLILEGAVFLLMGLEIRGILTEAQDQGGLGVVWTALALAGVALAVTLLLRAAFVSPLLWLLRRRTRGAAAFRERLQAMQERIAAGAPDVVGRPGRGRRRPMTQGQLEQFSRRIQQGLADVDYLSGSPLGVREGVVVVWAGMRGAVTVAAAQTIPLADAGGPEQRPLLVLIAFAVAAISLLLQGGTLALLIRAIRPATNDPTQLEEERARLIELLRTTSGEQPPRGGDESEGAFRLRHLRAQRAALLDARDRGVFDSETLAGALEAVDASEIAMATRGELRS